MKKLIVALTVLAMVCLFGFTAFAGTNDATTDGAVITTPSGKTINLGYRDNFTGAHGQPVVWDPVTSETPETDYNYRASVSYEEVDGNMSLILKNSDYGNMATFAFNPFDDNGVWTDWVNYRGDAYVGANTTALVFALKTDSDILFAPEGTRWDNANGFPGYLCDAADILLINASDSKTAVAEVVYDEWARYLCSIPAGFDGYLVVPTACITTNNAEGATGDWNVNGVNCYWNLGFFLKNVDETDQATVAIKDMYYINETLPTLEDCDYVGYEEPSSSADLSVIAYAAAAIVGCGALVIGKKRA